MDFRLIRITKKINEKPIVPLILFDFIYYAVASDDPGERFPPAVTPFPGMGGPG